MHLRLLQSGGCAAGAGGYQPADDGKPGRKRHRGPEEDADDNDTLGEDIRDGAEDVGDAVKQGVDDAGNAVKNGADKIEDALDGDQTDGAETKPEK